jgi:hypothetical protein
MSRKTSTDEFIDVQILITMRKAEYYNHIWNKMKKHVRLDLQESTRKAFIETVASMDNHLFLSDEEKMEKKIRTDLSFNLNGENIRDKFLEKLSALYKDIYGYVSKLID